MQSIPIISTDSALERIRLALQTIDALRLPSSVATSCRNHSRPACGEDTGSGPAMAARTWAENRRPGTGHRISRRSLSRCIAPFDARRTAPRHWSVSVAQQPPSHAGYLDVESYTAVQCHPRTGAQWLEPYRFLRNASVIIAHHHERWDGSGYPYGIRGTFIPIEARVLAIADAFDAIQVPLVTDQQTRDQVAYRILTVASGTQFDPHLVEMCGHCLQQPNLFSY